MAAVARNRATVQTPSNSTDFCFNRINDGFEACKVVTVGRLTSRRELF